MTSGTPTRHGPVVLPDGGVVVPAAQCAQLAAILDGLIAQAARPTPAGVRRPVVSEELMGLAAACRHVSVEVEMRRHRDMAEARLSILSSQFSDDLSLIPTVREFDADEIGCARVSEILGLTEQRVRQLASSGRIPARRAPRGVWAFRLADVMTFAQWRGRGGGDNGKRAEPGGPAA